MLKKRFTDTRKGYFPLLLFIGASLLIPQLTQAQCVPASAQIWSSGDDNTAFWVNGTPVPGEATYCQPPGCIPTPIPVPLSDFDAGTTVVFAVATTNVNPNLTFSSFDLDITCVGGGKQEITSSQSNLYYDPNGNCGGAVPPPNDPSGNAWNSFIYNPTTNFFTNPGVLVTGTTYVDQIYNPATGAVVPFLSYNSSAAAGSCGILYWRYGEVLPTPEPTLSPPDVTVTNTLISGSVTTNGNTLYASYAVTVCNSGSPIEGVPVTLTDTFSNDMQGNSSGCPGSPFPQSPQYQCGSPYQVIFPTGLQGGGTCEAVTVNIINNYYPNNYCDPVTAIAVVNWAAASSPVSSNVVTFSIPCMGTPTNTATNTSSTPPPTPTNTLSPTPLPCGAYSGPLLNLQVENSNNPCSGNQMTINYKIYNWGTTPVALAGLNIVMYVNTGPYAVDLNGAYSPYFYSPTGTQESGYTTNMSYHSLGTTITCGSKVYNGVVTLSFSTSSQTTIDPNGGYASTSGQVQMYLNGYPGQNFDATCDAYSDYASGGYRDDSGYVLLTGGSLVQEVTNGAGAVDPNSGQLPCITSFVTCTPTPGGGVNTATNTCTNTSTPTPTNTPTFTATSTITNTGTPTPTNTPTYTATDTPTATYTPTNIITPTFTDTPTITSTNTSTDTPTLTDTATVTNTATNTSTTTATHTPTNTATNTVPNTPTNTPTNTSTSTITPTVTNTSTPAAIVTMAKHVSEATAQAGDTLTYSIGVTVAGNSADNVVVTDVLPSGLIFVSFGSVPAGAATNASGQNLKWTFPSPLAVGNYQLTYQVQVDHLVGGGLLTNNAQLSYTGQTAPLTSSVNVQVPGQFTVDINIYNSAGEVVKTLPAQSFSQPINSITLQSSSQITTLQGPGNTIQIYYDGILIGTWDGTNNSENPVTNGNYLIKVDSTSSTGIVTSVSRQATVNRQLSNITATIYNSAGEVVRTLYNVVAGATALQMTNVELSPQVISPGSGATNAAELQIIIATSGTPVTLTWDGTNNSSTAVTPGSYTIQLHWDDGQGQTSDISRSVLVISGGGTGGTVVAEPNVLEPGGTMTAIFNGTGITGAWTLSVRIYTIAGQMVKSTTGTPGTATAQWTATNIASGIYIASVEVQDVNGGVLKQQTLKILVLH